MSVPTRSLATRLFFLAAFWSFLVLIIAGVVLTTIYARAAEAAFDQRLRIFLNELIADLSSPIPVERSEFGQMGEPRFFSQNSGWYWQILRLDGGERVTASSRSLYGARLASQLSGSLANPVDTRRQSYVSGPDDKRLRLVERRVDLGDEGQFIVAVAGEAEELDVEIREFRIAVAVAFVLLAAALLVTTLFQVRVGLRPLTDLRRAVAEIREGGRDRIAGQYPSEIAPLAGELNLLLETNRDVLQRARTQVGNLAHALKTPLSVLVNEAESHSRELPEKVAEQAKVMRHHIDYYLSRARAAANAGALGSVAEVRPVIEGLIRVFAKMHQDRGIEFAVTCPQTLKFRGERQDLEEMFGNLVDNASKWAASRVVIAVAPIPQTGGVAFELLVDNDGPPLSPEERAAVLKRGVRLDESKPGSGLGLSIVADLSGMYGGRVELLDSPLGGVRARLELPAV